MKQKSLLRTASGVLALTMAAALAGCGATASTDEVTAESAASSTDESSSASEASTDESAADTYAYLADFSLSSAFDDNGYLKDIVAGDYVTLPENYDSLTLSAEASTVAAEDVEEYINTNILANYATTEQITDRAAADGDSVNIAYVGTVDGVEFEGGSSDGYDLTLGSGSFIDDFEDQIVGHMPGETFDVNVTFPENYGSTDLAGKDAVFSTTLNYINEQVTPELTDEWVAANLSESMGLADAAAVNDYVNETLLFDQQANEIYGQLIDGSTISEDVPAELTEYLNDSQLYTAYQYATMYGTDLTTFLSSYGYDDADTYLSAVSASVDSMQTQILVMQAIAEKLGIVCDTAAMNENFEDYFGTDDTASYTDAYGENYVKMNILHNMVMQRLIDDAEQA